MTNDAPTPVPETGLKSAFEASLSVDLSDLSFDDCLKRKTALLGNARSLDQLEESELIEFHALCVRLRHLQQPAGKPAAKSKKTVTTAAAVASDFT